MLEKLHDQIVGELAQSSRTDTLFVVTAVVFNLVVLGINSSVSAAAANNRTLAADLIFAIFVVVTVLINTSALIALLLGRRTRSSLLQGLIQIYEDSEIAKYYPTELLSTYGTRYLLFAGVILLLALTAVIVPLVIRLML